MGRRWSGANREGLFRLFRRRPPTKFAHNGVFNIFLETVLRQLLLFPTGCRSLNTLVPNQLPNGVSMRFCARLSFLASP